jgi:hypothetical protein
MAALLALRNWLTRERAHERVSAIEPRSSADTP